MKLTAESIDRQGFDHATQTGFLLEGKHRSQKCESCHNETKIPESARAVRWDSGGFEHDKTRLPLDVAHRNVACAECHKDQSAAAGKPIRMYGGTPTECVKCH